MLSRNWNKAKHTKSISNAAAAASEVEIALGRKAEKALEVWMRSLSPEQKKLLKG
jgi:hypothetical protein